MSADLLADPDGIGPGIDLRRVAENWRAEARLNNAVVLNVDVAEPAAESNRQDYEGDQRDPDYRILEVCSLALLAFLSFRDLEFNGHFELAVRPCPGKNRPLSSEMTRVENPLSQSFRRALQSKFGQLQKHNRECSARDRLLLF